MQINVKSVNIKNKLEQLNVDGEFIKYPDMFKRNSCLVRINNDDYLNEDEFLIVSSKFNLPRQIYLYGKKESNENIIYLNQWMDIFLDTIENGYISKNDFKKSYLKYELAIGIPYEFRKKAYNEFNWKRNNVIEFLSCLFDAKLEEANYQQQDILELMVA